MANVYVFQGIILALTRVLTVKIVLVLEKVTVVALNVEKHGHGMGLNVSTVPSSVLTVMTL
jgi:hypothetical protein